jgi:MoaA/NifB/PqqE/SkfB family radical SAM enzyme
MKRLITIGRSVISRKCGLRPKSLPLVVAWVTGRCNLHCQMCGQWRQKDFSNELSTEEWFMVIDSAYKLGAVHFTITGGEPFLRKDLLDITGRIRSYGMGCHVCTNGTLITEGIARNLNVNSISVSLDSSQEIVHNELRGSDCFSNARQAIINIKRHAPKVKVGINCLICKKNYAGLSDMVRMARELRVDRLNVMPIHTNLQHKGNPKEQYEGLLLEKDDLSMFEQEFSRYLKLSKQNAVSKEFLSGIPEYFRGNKKRHTCHAGYISCAITADGGVMPCDNMEPVANVRDMPLHEIWMSADFHKKRQEVISCQENCWDTTHANLNILISPISLLTNPSTIACSLRYHLN